jgi:hypothetical protein
MTECRKTGQFSVELRASIPLGTAKLPASIVDRNPAILGLEICLAASVV